MLKKGMLRGYGDFYMIGLFTTSPYTFHTKKKVTSMDGLKGLKIRAVGPAMVDSVKMLGAAPEPMPFTKIVEAISRGVIDGTTGHPIAVYDFGVSKVTSSHYFGRLGTVNLALFMNKKKYEALPAAAKAALDKYSGEPQSLAFGKMSDTRNAELRAQWAKDPKRTVTVQSKAEEAKWDKTLAPVVDAWVKKHPKGKQLLGALKAELAAIRAGK
jgi:TRAP-type C4-dicarboxylate transport system substrate-binding protein